MLGAVWLGVLTGIVRSGIKPGPSDPNKWYDRAIRIVGGLLIGLMALLGLIMHVIQIT
jgi:hypothetical protein